MTAAIRCMDPCHRITARNFCWRVNVNISHIDISFRIFSHWISWSGVTWTIIRINNWNPLAETEPNSTLDKLHAFETLSSYLKLKLCHFRRHCTSSRLYTFGKKNSYNALNLFFVLLSEDGSSLQMEFLVHLHHIFVSLHHIFYPNLFRQLGISFRNAKWIEKIFSNKKKSPRIRSLAPLQLVCRVVQSLVGKAQKFEMVADFLLSDSTNIQILDIFGARSFWKVNWILSVSYQNLTLEISLSHILMIYIGETCLEEFQYSKQFRRKVFLLSLWKLHLI